MIHARKKKRRIDIFFGNTLNFVIALLRSGDFSKIIVDTPFARYGYVQVDDGENQPNEGGYDSL